jgi:hypothetical protein
MPRAGAIRRAGRNWDRGTINRVSERRTMSGGRFRGVARRCSLRRVHAQRSLAESTGIAVPFLHISSRRDDSCRRPQHLHGDLLGQNLQLSLDDEPMRIIDWTEAQIGDPAYDLAIVTRGVRQPFQVAGGLDRLLDANNARARRPVIASEVHLYEFCLSSTICSLLRPRSSPALAAPTPHASDPPHTATRRPIPPAARHGREPFNHRSRAGPSPTA